MNNDYLLQEKELKQISDLLFQLTGNTVDIAKKEMLSSRWQKLLRENDISLEIPFSEAIRKVEFNTPQEFINRYTTNTTYFFREIGQMNWLYDNLETIKQPSGRLDILCLPSSSGEEVFSLATILNKAKSEQNLIWSIDGFDISKKVLDLAKKGQYSFSKSDNKIPEHLRTFWNELFEVKTISDKNLPDTKMFTLKRPLSNVTFNHGNIMNGVVNFNKYDVVFCRNMLIYFKEKEVELIIGNLLRMLKPGGILAIGHSETAFGHKNDLTKVSNYNIFRNTPSN